METTKKIPDLIKRISEDIDALKKLSDNNPSIHRNTIKIEAILEILKIQNNLED